MADERTCEGCKFGCLFDFGYSNYTTEGSEFFCTVKAHPEDGFDRWFGGDERLNFAAECPKFEAGEAISLDTEREDVVYLTPEQRALYDAWAEGQ